MLPDLCKRRYDFSTIYVSSTAEDDVHLVDRRCVRCWSGDPPVDSSPAAIGSTEFRDVAAGRMVVAADLPGHTSLFLRSELYDAHGRARKASSREAIAWTDIPSRL